MADTEIDVELTKVQEEQAIWEPADNDEASDGMLVEVDLTGEIEGSDDDPYNEEGASFIIGSGSAPPEVDEALQGAKIGDERIATKVLPDDLEDSDKAGKTVTYTISVKGLKRKVLPEIDDDLATTIGLENLDELRQRIHDRRCPPTHNLIDDAAQPFLGDAAGKRIDGHNAVRVQMFDFDGFPVRLLHHQAPQVLLDFS